MFVFCFLKIFISVQFYKNSDFLIIAVNNFFKIFILIERVVAVIFSEIFFVRTFKVRN